MSSNSFQFTQNVGQRIPVETPLASIIHTDMLPTLNVFQHHALANLGTDICPWTNPMKWNEENYLHVNSIIEDTVKLTKRAEIRQADFAHQVIIYPVNLASKR